MSHGLAASRKAQAWTYTGIKIKVKCSRDTLEPYFIHFVSNGTGKKEKEKNNERKKIAVEMMWMMRVVLKMRGGQGVSDLPLGWPSTVPAPSRAECNDPSRVNALTGMMVKVFNNRYSRPVCTC